MQLGDPRSRDDSRVVCAVCDGPRDARAGHAGVFEAGAYSGLTRYLSEAAQIKARGSFYRQMLDRRWLIALVCGAAVILAGPIYARSTHFPDFAQQPWLFVLIAAIVAVSLSRLLAFYGLLALFETRKALLLQQGFLVLRSLLLALIAVLGGGLWHLLSALLATTLLEAVIVDRQLWHLIGHERAPVSRSFINQAQKFGLLTIFDKACAALGSGSILLLVLAPHHSAEQIAFLGLATDLVGKLISLTVMPMGNLVAPYLSQTSDAPGAQALAIGRVVKFSSLLYCFSAGAGLLILPWFVPTVYGGGYSAAAWLAALLLIPTAFESWIRGSCSPALLRNGRYGDLVKVNIAQAIVTLVTLALVYRQPVGIVIAAVGGARSAVAALNLVLLRRLVPAHTYRVPTLCFGIGAMSCATAWVWATLVPFDGVARVIAAVLIFALIFYAGLRWLVFRDEDTLRLMHRVAGARIKLLNRLLPALPFPNA